MKCNKILILGTMLAVCSALSAQDPAGMLDLTFNNSGKVIYDNDRFDLYQDVKVQPDGKIVAVGSSMSATYSMVIEVTRFLADGSFDPSFGINGHFNYSPNVETAAYKCLIRENGKILIAGHTTDYTEWGMLIIQLDENGTLDPDFGNSGVVYQKPGPGENIVSALELQSDGKILIAGYSQDNNFRNVPVLLRFTDTGILDATFGINGIAEIPVTEVDNEFSTICVQSDGKIVAAGHISNGMNWYSLLIARFDQDGNLDSTYGNHGLVNMNLDNVDDEFFDMNLSDNDGVILTGFTVTQADYFYHLLLMKFDSYGQPITSFGVDGKVIIGEVPYSFGDAMITQTDGKIVVAGCTGDLMPGNNDWALWRFNPDGSLDTVFGNNGSATTDFFGNADEALGVSLFENKIILAGKVRNASDLLDFAVARYTNDTYYNVSLPETMGKTSISVSPNPVCRNGIINLNFELRQPEEVSIELINMSGISVYSLVFDKQAAGLFSHNFSIPVPIGVYMLKIKGENSTILTTKLVVI
jgi:uncharacterized delta-60 repeat protein